MNNNLSFEDLVELYLDCCRKGSIPDVTEFANKYPEYSKELTEILPLLNDLEELGSNNKTNCETNIPAMIDSEYRLTEKIGSGGMGLVFEALQISLNRKVAVKLLSPSLVKEQKQRKQFENEAKIIAMLHHPNIVKILSAKCTQDFCYYAMELIDGNGLDRCNITDIKQIAEIALQACKAMAYAHSCNVMHRDIKPSNLLLDNDGVLHVSDFGLAFVLKDKISDTGNIDPKSGTIRYMAPEKLANGENSFYTDQYSLGATLYEIVAKTPFVTAATPKELPDKIKSGKLPKLICKEKDFAAIINKAISVNPENRYPNMEEMADDIEHFLRNEPVNAANPSPLHRFILWKKRKPLAAILGLVSAFCATAFITALITGYIQTTAALKLAQRNADTADTALSRIFSYLQTQPPSASGSVLMDTLMPYYQEISEQSGLSKNKLIEANKIVGRYAMHSGNYNLAAKTYNRLSKLQEDAHSLNCLAEALQRLGRKKEADKIRTNIINRYRNSSNPQEQYEVAAALLMFPQDKNRVYNAFIITNNLIEKYPSNPDYRYKYALILSQYPDLQSNGTNPFVILKNLAEKYQDNPDYAIALFEYANNNFQKIPETEIQEIIELSGQFAGRFPNTPKIITSAVRLRKTYIRYLRKNEETAKARKESERLAAMLEVLYYNPNTPDSVKETLIRIQLERLKLLKRANRFDIVIELSEKIKGELQSYHGKERQRFYNQLYN